MRALNGRVSVPPNWLDNESVKFCEMGVLPDSKVKTVSGEGELCAIIIIS